MLEINITPFPELITERLFLRQVNPEDVNEIFILRSDPRLMKYLDREPAKNKEDAIDFINKIRKLEADNECITWAITLKGNNKLCGTICFWNILKEHYRAEIGYSLLYEFQDKGIMQEAINEVINFGFKNLNLHSIEANVNPANKASIKLLEKNKFIREGYYKENYFFRGKFLDSAIYSLLCSSEE